MLTSALNVLLFSNIPSAQICLEFMRHKRANMSLRLCCSRDRLTLMCKVKKKRQQLLGQKRKNKLSPPYVSTSLLPCLKKGACYLDRPQGWNPRGILCREVQVQWCSQLQPGGVILRLADLCFQRSRKGSLRCAAVSQKEFIKVVNNGRNWSSLIGSLLFSLVPLTLMNCCHSFFC